jgi:hypothetical protein
MADVPNRLPLAIGRYMVPIRRKSGLKRRPIQHYFGLCNHHHYQLALTCLTIPVVRGIMQDLKSKLLGNVAHYGFVRYLVLSQR